MVRRLLLAAALCSLAGAFGAARAHAAVVPQRPARPYTVQSAHFLVHFNSDPATAADYATAKQAGDLAALAERALTIETGWGYAPPTDDGNGLIDIYIVDLTAFPGVGGFAIPDGNTVPSSGSIDIAQSQLGVPWEYHLVAHELFHLIQYDYWLPATLSDHYLLEGEAEWAGYKVDGYSTGIAGSTGPPDLSVDCFDSVAGLMKCSSDGYANGGYSRWSFYEYLAQRFGVTFAKETLQDAQSGGSAAAGLAAALTAHGGATLGGVYTDFAVRGITGGWGVAGLDAEIPAHAVSILTGTDTGDVSAGTFSVDHLATRYVEIRRGDGAGDHACFAATLTVTVTLPAGVGATPYFYWNGKGSSAVKLDVSGSTATTTVPWDTCQWAQNAGYLVLANPSTTVNAALFTVSAHLTVDPNTPASSTKAPDPQSVYGGVTPVDSAQVPPAITLLAAQTLKISVAKPTIKLVAQSNGDGALHATLGSFDLGTQAVRAGSNALVFAVPKSLLSTLRRSAATGNTLMLTPLSPSGTVTGTALTRTVVVQAAPKPKKKQ